VSETLRKI
jgi:hypothetical protein